MSRLKHLDDSFVIDLDIVVSARYLGEETSSGKHVVEINCRQGTGFFAQESKWTLKRATQKSALNLLKNLEDKK